MEQPRMNQPPTPQWSHLEKGYAPIRTCINDAENLTEETKEKIQEIKNNGLEVPMDSISQIDEKEKHSLGYAYCTGIIMTGVDKHTGKQISFMAHKDPHGLKSDSFRIDLEKRTSELLSRSLPRSVDAVLFGGRGGHIHDTDRHEDSMKYWSEICKKILHFEPTILGGPNIWPLRTADNWTEKERKERDKWTDVYFDTEHRRLELVRVEQYNSKLNEPFTAADYSKQKERWEGAE